MKNVLCLDIQSLIEKDVDVTLIIDQICKLMMKEYPNFYAWFNHKVLNELENNTRNIVFLYKHDKVIGFVNIKHTTKEKKLSNIYVKPTLFYNQHWNLLIDKATELLDEKKPVAIITNKEIRKYVSLLIDRKWLLTDKNKAGDYVFNRYDEIEMIGKMLKKKK